MPPATDPVALPQRVAVYVTRQTADGLEHGADAGIALECYYVPLNTTAGVFVDQQDEFIGRLTRTPGARSLAS